MFALALAGTAVGCDSDGTGDGPDDGLNFRGYEGDGDLTMFVGTAADDDDCDIWGFIGPTVQGGTASSVPGQSVLEISAGGLVRDASGTATCEIYWDGAKKLRDLETGEVLMTASQVFLIDGDFDGQGAPNWQAADYTFRGSQIREGGWWGKPILTADVHLEWTHGTRRLMVGALIEGLCGAPGLDAAPPPTGHPEG
ncbi:MAG: hypothetical protein AAF721_14090 [Myxococcota bacterium]